MENGHENKKNAAIAYFEAVQKFKYI